MPDYKTIGKKLELKGRTLYAPDFYNDGLTFGTIFKDEKAFREDKNAVCYIPEHAFDDAETVMVDGEKYYDAEGYTRADLEAMIVDDNGNPTYQDEDGDKLDIEYFFSILCWAYPETYLNEFE